MKKLLFIFLLLVNASICLGSEVTVSQQPIPPQNVCRHITDFENGRCPICFPQDYPPGYSEWFEKTHPEINAGIKRSQFDFIKKETHQNQITKDRIVTNNNELENPAIPERTMIPNIKIVCKKG